MTLRFFAQRFSIREELLSWAIEPSSSSCNFVLSIDGAENMVIDIARDCFRTCNSKNKLQPATVNPCENGFEFKTQEGDTYLLSLKELEEIYVPRLLSLQDLA